MKLSEEKIDIIQKVIELENEEKLDRIHELLSEEENLNHLRKISYQEFKQRLQQWITS